MVVPVGPSFLPGLPAYAQTLSQHPAEWAWPSLVSRRNQKFSSCADKGTIIPQGTYWKVKQAHQEAAGICFSVIFSTVWPRVCQTRKGQLGSLGDLENFQNLHSWDDTWGFVNFCGPLRTSRGPSSTASPSRSSTYVHIVLSLAVLSRRHYCFY